MNSPFPRCFSSLGCPELSLEQVADLALKFQVPLLELRILENRMDLPELLETSPGGWNGARALLDAKGLRVQVVGTSFLLTQWEESHWRDLLRQAELAAALGAPFVRVFGGGKWEVAPSAEGLASAARLMQRWRKERIDRGWEVDLVVETHDAFSSTARCLELIDRVGEPMPILWDTHHTWRMAGEAPADTWRALGAHVKHIHFKDSTSKPASEHMSYTYVPPGHGEMPFAEVLRVLKEWNYAGALSLEWEKKWHPDLAPMPEALAACAASGWW